MEQQLDCGQIWIEMRELFRTWFDMGRHLHSQIYNLHGRMHEFKAVEMFKHF